MLNDNNVTVLSEFKDYANFSVRVDQYFNVINIYGMHHEGIKSIYKVMPTHDKITTLLNSNLDEETKRFLTISYSALGYMATTNIFNSIDDQFGGNISKDALNFSFYTCYCFQWSLFEDFVKTMIRKLIDAGVFPENVVTELELRWRQTKKLFDLIESGAVFGRNPFSSILPVIGWIPSTEDINYNDLNAIRDLRNSFIHGVESPEITSEDIGTKQRRYNRSMWILRKFAENIQWEVQRSLGIWNGE